MATTFAWKINTLERETSDGFVFTAHYSVVAISDVLDPEGNPYNSGAYGSVGFQRPDDLIPYDQLQEEQVIGWVQEALGGDEKVAEIEAALQARIDEAISPSKESGTPWAS
jgi:hypothetical protein